MNQTPTATIDSGVNLSESQLIDCVHAERRAKRIWVGGIVTILGLQVIGGIVTVFLATGDPTVVVIPNYYQSGLNWDSKRQKLDQFINLGWHVEIEIQATNEELLQRQIAIHLMRDKHFIGKQRVSASVFHCARGSEVFKLNFDEAHEGQYVAICRLTQAGLWQFEIAIEGDQGLAEARFNMDIGNSGSTKFRFPKAAEKIVKN